MLYRQILSLPEIALESYIQIIAESKETVNGFIRQ